MADTTVLFKKKMVVTRAPVAPQPQPGHLVSKHNPAPKVAEEFPRPDPEYKSERLQTPENSPIEAPSNQSVFGQEDHHAARRQIKIYRQPGAQGRPYSRGL